MGGPSQTTTSSQQTDPWAPQQSYLLSGFQNAQNAYNQATANGPYSGNYVAAPNANQYSAYNNAYNFANGAGSNAVSSILGGAGASMGAGLSGATGALSGLSGMTGDNTQQIIGDASQYANNPAISGMVKAAMSDANQNAAENTLPNLYRSAAGSGNINSDRTALAQGVVQRGLDQQAGNISANLRGNAYQSGISSALQGNSQSLQALAQQGYLGSNLFGAGMSGMAGGINAQTANSNLATSGANGVQGLDQSKLNNQLAQFQGTSNYPWQQLQNYWNIVGQNKGSTTTGTSTSTTDPGLMSTLGMGVGILGSLF